jgi:hypothetical protein
MEMAIEMKWLPASIHCQGAQTCPPRHPLHARASKFGLRPTHSNKTQKCNYVALQTSPKVSRLRRHSPPGPTSRTPATPETQSFSYWLDDGGIDFDTALVACGLVAGNRWGDGFELKRSCWRLLGHWCRRERDRC